MKIIFFTFLLWIVAVVADCAPPPQMPGDAEEARQHYLRERERVLEPIRDRYLRELDRLLSSHTRNGNIDAAISIRKEMARIRSEKGKGPISFAEKSVVTAKHPNPAKGPGELRIEFQPGGKASFLDRGKKSTWRWESKSPGLIRLWHSELATPETGWRLELKDNGSWLIIDAKGNRSEATVSFQK